MLHTSRFLRPYSAGLGPYRRPLRPFSVSQCRRDSSNVPPTKHEEKSQPSPPENSPATPEVDSAASSSSARPIPVDQVKQIIQEWTEKTSSTIRQQADTYTVRVAKTFSKLGSELNKVTGYEAIESLKKRVVEQESKIDAARLKAKQAKEDYDKAVSQRAKSQREVNDLLQRKSTWTDDDVLRFTALVRQDHLFEQEEARAKAVAEQAEGEVEREFSELMRVILHRYHEEQIWSDKIRSVSTYGQLTVMGLNLLVFILAIILVEPWKRRRLAQTFEKRVQEMTEETLAEYNEQTKNLTAKLQKQEETLSRLLESVYYASQPTVVVDRVPSDVEVAEGQGAVEMRPVESIVEQSPWTVWASNPQYVVAATATTAAMLGWFARSWFG